MPVKNEVNEAGTHRWTQNKNGNFQWRKFGKSTEERNEFGRCLKSYGTKIDELVKKGIYTKDEIKNIVGCGESKVRSHILDLGYTHDKKIDTDPVTGVVSFRK